MKKKLTKQFLIALTFLFATGIYAQNVTGLVTSDDGPLPGATVLVQGSNEFATTDFDGNFSIEANQGDILIVSFVGYQTQEVAVDSDNLTITLALGNLLDEVIVTTGYGTQSKRDITGAVSTIEADELNSVPATTFSQQMQGRASGISIVSDATPGGEATVRIRGFGSIGNNNPLYIIDGVPSQSQGNLNPGDIESLQILKDASAASIYGARAANGVIIITTKKGKVGEPRISVSSFYGTQTAANDVDALNAEDLGKYLYLADYYAGKTPSHGQYTYSGSPENPQVSIPNYVFPSGAASVDESLYSLTPSNVYPIVKSTDTNWWEEVTRTAPMWQTAVDASAATEKSQYAFNATMFSQDAITEFQGYKRVSIRLNSSTKTLGDKLTVGENFTVSLDSRKGTFGNDQEQNAVSGSYKHHPLLPVYDITGFFAGSRGLNLGNNSNPYATLSRGQDNYQNRQRVFGNVFAELEIANDFKLRTSFGANIESTRRLSIGRANPEYVEGNFNNGSTSFFNSEYEWTWTNTLSWAKIINDVHDISAYVGVEAIEGFGEYFGASRNQFPFENKEIISYLDAGNQGTAGNFGNVYKDFSLWSQFVQANYQFNEKYLAQFTLRNDSSSRFRAATNSALFPAFSLGWRLSEEDFMSGISFIDDLKFRYGWGQTGNQEIGDYNSFTQFRSQAYNSGYPIDGSASSPTLGYDPAQFGNPEAKWEATTSNNLGFDALLFDQKLFIEFDLWNRTTTDMLLVVPAIYSAGDAAAPAVNIAEMYNEGIDFAADWQQEFGNDFRLSIGGNISAYVNEIRKLDEFGTPIFGSNRRVPALTVTEPNAPISSLYGFQVEGIFQSQAEADAWAPYGTTGYNAPGKFKYADINNDGEINDDDRTIIGNPHPDFVYGINLNLTYKNLNLNVFGNGVQGNDIYNYVRYFADFNTFQGNKSTRALTEAWQPSNPSAPRAQWTAANPDAQTPIMDANDQISSRTSSYLIEDGSYFRLRNIQLTYTFGDAVNSALGISGGQVYFQGQNLFTFTNYSGLNPEIQTTNDIQLGYDGGFMPVSKTLTLGLNLSLF